MSTGPQRREGDETEPRFDVDKLGEALMVVSAACHTAGCAHLASEAFGFNCEDLEHALGLDTSHIAKDDPFVFGIEIGIALSDGTSR